MRPKLGWTLVLGLTLAVAAAAVAGSDNTFVFSPHGKHLERIDLSDLADGETRTFGEGDLQVTATRRGDIIEIEYPAGDRSRTLECVLGEGSCYVMVSDDDSARAFIVSVAQEHAGHGLAHAEAALSWTSDDGEVHVIPEDADFHFFAEGEGHAVMQLSGSSDVSVFECPEGDTTMRLKKDEVAGTYFCPQHNLELEQVEAQHRVHKIKVIKTKEGEPN